MNWWVVALAVDSLALVAMGLTWRFRRLTVAYFLGFNTMLVVAIYTVCIVPFTARLSSQQRKIITMGYGENSA